MRISLASERASQETRGHSAHVDRSITVPESEPDESEGARERIDDHVASHDVEISGGWNREDDRDVGVCGASHGVGRESGDRRERVDIAAILFCCAGAWRERVVDGGDDVRRRLSGRGLLKGREGTAHGVSGRGGMDREVVSGGMVDHVNDLIPS